MWCVCVRVVWQDMCVCVRVGHLFHLLLYLCLHLQLVVQRVAECFGLLQRKGHTCTCNYAMHMLPWLHTICAVL